MFAAFPLIFFIVFLIIFAFAGNLPDVNRLLLVSWDEFDATSLNIRKTLQ